MSSTACRAATRVSTSIPVIATARTFAAVRRNTTAVTAPSTTSATITQASTVEAVCTVTGSGAPVGRQRDRYAEELRGVVGDRRVDRPGRRVAGVAGHLLGVVQHLVPLLPADEDQGGRDQ